MTALNDQLADILVGQYDLALMDAWRDLRDDDHEIARLLVLSPGDRILSMDLDAGGHLTHGATASVTSKYFEVARYGIDPDGWLDYAEIRELAHRTQPSMIIWGASSYPRRVDFAEFRRIADEVNAYLLADISHISGLVATGEHPSPINHAHFTTTSTYKQLNGPRGGLILVGQRGTERVRGATRSVSRLVDRAVFPGFQGTPNFAAIAAKAVALRKAAGPHFQERMIQVRVLADTMAATLKKRGLPVVTDGTDTHMVLVDLRNYPTLTGKGVEDLLGRCSILVNRNRLPGDERPAMVTSGLRFGSNELSARQIPVPRVEDLVDKIAQLVIAASAESSTNAPETARATTELREYARYLCARYPVSDGPNRQ